MLARQAADARAEIEAGDLRVEFDDVALAAPVEIDEVMPVARRPSSTPPVRTRPQPGRRRQVPQQQEGPMGGGRGGLVAALAGIAFAILGVALVLGLFLANEVDEGTVVDDAPATTVVFEDEIVEIPLIIEVVNRDGYYLAPGIIDPRNEVAEAVQLAATNGVGFAAVVLLEDWPEPSSIAGEIEAEVGQDTVLVLTATQAGISSSIYDSDVISTAYSAGSEGFAEGGDPGYVRAVVDVLIAQG